MSAGRILVAAQLSSLFSFSNAPSVVLQSSRQSLQTVSQPDTDVYPEHAISSSIYHTLHAGPILLRVIHGGLIVELISLTTPVLPIRFVFPASVVSTPAVCTWGEQELHLLAVTVTGSLYRLVLPTTNPTRLWHDEAARNWCREYILKNVSDLSGSIVHIQGPHGIAIGLGNGSLLRVEVERIGDTVSDDLWTETVSQPKSFLGTFTSYIPGFHSGTNAAPEFLCVAGLPEPTEFGYIWTLSRDRTLRLWSASRGCVASKSLSFQADAASGNKPVLLNGDAGNLLRVYSLSPNGEKPFAVAFTPTPDDPHCGGYFQIVDSSSDQLHELRTIGCSPTSVNCHLQDFILNNGVLYTLWERHGTSMVQSIKLDAGSLMAVNDAAWETSSYGEETDLTPAYLDEVLLAPGSLTEKFMEVILRPGIFSPLTIRTALEQYIDACLSLPGPPPPELMSSYTSVAENIVAVVGCTVTLVQDPHTGATQHDRYWSALKRDWEGFIARCREVERSARWPLVLSKGQYNDEVIVVERERVGVVAREDLPITIHRYLSDTLPVESHFSILDIAWSLCCKIGTEVLRNLESNIVDVLHQEIAFSIVDIMVDQVRRSDFREMLGESTQNWVVAKLQEVEDLERSIKIILDLAAGFDLEIKREEDEVELLLPPARSEWKAAIAASYISTSLNARYDICLALTILLFFMADDLGEWDPCLLEEVFAVFRGLSMLRYIARQPTVDQSHDRQSSQAASTDDVIARMGSMQVSGNQPNFAPTLSLVHRLISQSNEHVELPSSGHRFLDNTGLLQSTSPAHVTHYEASFCERLRDLGYYQVAREMLAWLPRTPGVTFVTARLFINLGRGDDAAYLLEKLAGSFGPDSGLSFEDAETLAVVLPRQALYDSEFNFYLEASSIFRENGLTQHEVGFLQLALSVAPPETNTPDLWYGLVRGHIDLGFWEEAYSAIIATPFDSVRRECISQLVYRMCEENAVEELISLNFGGFSSEVDDALAFKARNTDPRVRPFYSRILYTWYTRRGDHRSAARTMYMRAHKLQEISGSSAEISSLMDDQAESYLLAINSLSLLEEKKAWFVVQTFTNNVHELESRKRRKLIQNLPSSSAGGGSEIIDLHALRFDYTLLSAKKHLVHRDPTLLSAPEALLTPPLVIQRLGQANQFDFAMTTARALNLDMSELFVMLAVQCMRLSRNPDAIFQEDASDWLLTDNAASWPGSPADRGWRYLKMALERHDGPEMDYRYSKATLEAILAHDSSLSPPPWLVHLLEDYHHEYLVRTSLKFDALESALEHTLSLVRKADSKLSRSPAKTPGATWLPYTLIDQVLAASISQGDLSARGQVLRKELQMEVSNRVKRMQKASLFSK
ncbi:nucleoporin Nup120/160-domain-containing protein [Pisolithus marmoratus]|nr:nucleoporin Nup120/160-domain-containing protein [Pisolithus marmoratus]